MTLREALSAATRQLEAVSDTARLDAELLMAHALGVERDVMILGHLDEPAPGQFAGLIARRLAHEPVAYITGWRDFWTIRLSVGPGVLIPRPDSETLIEAAIAHFGKSGPRSILDLGTGPGTLLLAALAEWPNAHGLGIDASDRALEFARTNARALGYDHRAKFQIGDWAARIEGQFDLILCNPPYVEQGASLARELAHEPTSALFSGADGLNDYRRLIPQLAPLLATNGIICLEIGYTQGDAVTALAEGRGFAVSLHRDLGNRPRCLVLSAGAAA